MTAPTPPPGPDRPTDDELELVHAYLDGETTPAETARIEGDPVLVTAVASARRVQDEVRAQVAVSPVGDDQRERHVAAALSAFATAAGPSPADPASPAEASTGEVADLEARRERKTWYQRLPLPAVAAAAIILVVAAIAGVSQLGSDNDGDLTAIGDDVGDAAQDAPESPMALVPEDTEDAEDAEGDAFTSEADGGTTGTSRDDQVVLPRLDLETASYDTIEDFVADLAAEPTPTTSDMASPDTPVAAPGADDGLDTHCPDLAARYLDVADAYQAPAEVDGRDVIGVTFATPEGDTVIHVIEVASCELLVEA